MPRPGAPSAPGSRRRPNAWRGAISRPRSTPKRIDIEPDALAAEVSGELVTWIGREQVSKARKRYRLVFRIDGGRIGLLRFEERED